MIFVAILGLQGEMQSAELKTNEHRIYATNATRQVDATTDVSQESLIMGSTLTDLTIFPSLLNLRQQSCFAAEELSMKTQTTLTILGRCL